jgi:homoserine O-succinyltransferase
MPVIIRDDQPTLKAQLIKSGAIVLGDTEAGHQDIRPARIGLINLMPAATMEVTELQWLRYMSDTVLQIEPVLIKFDQDFRERSGASRENILSRYQAFNEVAEKGLDGLIITGGNLELADIQFGEQKVGLDFEQLKFYEQLRDIIFWARENVYSTIYSCIASHFALDQLYGLKRTIMKEKIFGVFDHKVKDIFNSPFTKGIDDIIRAPHARWGIIDTKEFNNCDADILAASNHAGWLLAQSKNNAGGHDMFLQGHPEYDRYDLHREFQRDWALGEAKGIPVGYYEFNNPASIPQLTWANDARALHSNWISAIYKHFSTNLVSS